MKYKKEYAEINKLIDNADDILIIPHVNPDSDALASSYALVKVIQNKNKIALIGLQEKLKNKYNKYAMPELSLTIIPEEIVRYKFNLIITTDIGSDKRTGSYHKLLTDNIQIINLDHHIDNNNFGDINIVDTAYSSTSELVFEYIQYNNLHISKDVATAIYTGIVADTGSFRYSLTTNETHIAAAKILQMYNIDSNAIYESLFENMNANSLKLTALVSSKLKTFYNGELALLYLKKQFLNECNADEYDARNLVNIGPSLETVQFSIFINEKSENKIKVSLRSKNDKINVNKIAQNFGGGGHNKAAGFILNTNFDEAYDNIKTHIIDKYQRVIN